MKISKANAATLGRILADALHKCDNLAERKGVLRAKEEIEDILACRRVGSGRAFTTEAKWKKYDAFMNSFEERGHYLEFITPTDDYEPSVSPRDCAIGGEEDSNWT